MGPIQMEFYQQDHKKCTRNLPHECDPRFECEDFLGHHLVRPVEGVGLHDDSNEVEHLALQAPNNEFEPDHLC